MQVTFVLLAIVCIILLICTCVGVYIHLCMRCHSRDRQNKTVCLERGEGNEEGGLTALAEDNGEDNYCLNNCNEQSDSQSDTRSDTGNNRHPGQYSLKVLSVT